MRSHLREWTSALSPILLLLGCAKDVSLGLYTGGPATNSADDESAEPAASNESSASEASATETGGFGGGATTDVAPSADESVGPDGSAGANGQPG